MSEILLFVFSLFGPDKPETVLRWKMEYAVQLTENLMLKQHLRRMEIEKLDCLLQEQTK